MKKIYEKLINTDAIVVAGINPRDTRGVKDIYQIFVERTRQIRRDNFLLTNVPVAAYSIEELGQGNPFSMKVMASFLRHNCIILPPIERYFYKDKMINDPYGDFKNFMNLVIRINSGKRYVDRGNVEYAAIGYKNIRD